MQFTYHGVEMTGFCHLYNLTWFNERTIELAVAFDFLEGRKGSGLEIGNVLGHYRPFTHHVIDRYERASWYQKQIIHNVDLFDVHGQWDWVVQSQRSNTSAGMNLNAIRSAPSPRSSI